MSHAELAMPLQRYVVGNNYNAQALRSDFARYTLESDTRKSLQKRITFHSYTKLDNDWVIDARLGTKHVGEYFKFDTPVQVQESTAGLKIAQMLVDEPVGTLAIWISPAHQEHKDQEGRLDISLKRNDVGFSFTESYGIVSTLQPEEYIFLAQRLAEHASGSYKFTTTEDLRSLVFIIHPIPTMNPWDRMQNIFPEPEIWETIKSGDAIKETLLAEKAASETEQEIRPLILKAQTEQDFIRVGARAERIMEQKGYKAMSGPCGRTNSDSLMQSYISTLHGGRIIQRNGETLFYVKNCGKCGKEINDYIPKGYRCTCDGVFEGC